MNLKTPIAPITFSKKAIAEIKRLMKEKGFDKTKKFRVGIKNNNNELSYIFCFDNQREDDVLYKAKDVTLIMKESDSIYLQG
ncbi:MAG: hypothetical protein LC122_03955, partial [Chitinophagales bacterium]|nr:hypothetical protein [Chitinophagales bacterium]